MCAFYGVVFVCFNWFLTEDGRANGGFATCKGANLERPVHLRALDDYRQEGHPDDDDFYGAVCSLAGEGHEDFDNAVWPQEIFYGYCHECKDSLRNRPNPIDLQSGSEWQEIRGLNHPFYTIKMEGPAGGDEGWELLDRAEAKEYGGEAWQTYAREAFLQVYRHHTVG